MNHVSPNPQSGAPKVVDYVVVVSNEEDCHAGYHQFAEKVNRKLKAGYLLLGQPFNVSQTLCQAMVRSADVPPVEDTPIFFKQSDPRI